MAKPTVISIKLFAINTINIGYKSDISFLIQRYIPNKQNKAKDELITSYWKLYKLTSCCDFSTAGYGEIKALITFKYLKPELFRSI